MRKGDLSMQTIVIMVILLLVLIVMMVAFTGRWGIFRGGLDKLGTDGENLCSKAGGTCLSANTACTNPLKGMIDCPDPMVCCKG